MNRFKKIYIVAFALLSLSGGVFLNVDTANAADARNFLPGRIIDDAVFTNSNSMSVDQIQSFLNSKVSCDTWGVKTSELGEGTRRQWMANRGIYPPFRCVTDYYENPSTGASNYGKDTIPSGAISAAQIIYNYSKQYNINPQAIIATLQKENGMITDEWPTPKQFSEAMGFGCPDNVAPGAPACDPSYKSFATQIYQATRHFRGYIDNQYCNGTWCTPYRVGQSNIMWHPNSACGSSSVYIENRATSALYSYTPYRPNQAALNAQYGTGDNCSAYGNRNFYMYFTDWFGSAHGNVQITSSLNLLSSVPGGGLFTDGFVEASFVIKNNTSQRQDIGNIFIAARDSQGGNYDFGTKHIVLEPHQEYLYRTTTNITKEDKYDFWIASYHDGVWDDDYPSVINGAVRKYSDRLVQKLPTISSDPVSDTELRVGKTSNISFSAINNSNYPLNLGKIGVGMRSPSGKNSDLITDSINNLAPKTTYTYTKPFVPKEVGEYKATVISTLNNGINWNNATYPRPTTLNDARTDFSVKSNPTLTEGPRLSIQAPRVGQKTTFTFKVKNFSEKQTDAGYVALVVRDPDNRNVDVGGVDLTTLASNTEYVYSGSRSFTKPGKYTAWIVSYKSGSWRDDLPVNESGDVLRKMTFNVKPSPTLTQGLTLSNPTPRAGEMVTGTFKVRNFSDVAVTVNKNLCYILRGNGKNYDFGCLKIDRIEAGQEMVFTGNRVVGEAGDYKAYFSMYDGNWHDGWTFEKEVGNEPTALSFRAKSNPTLTQGLSVSNTGAYAGDTIAGSFAVTNNGNTAINVNKLLCYIVRDELNRNNDLGCLDLASLQPGQTVAYTGSREFAAGKYRAYFSMYDGQRWHENWSFDQETGTEPRTLNFTVKTSPVLTQGIAISNASPVIGETITGMFTVQNKSSKAVTVNKNVCYVIRDDYDKNHDLGCLSVGTLEPMEQLVFNKPKAFKSAGKYRAYFSMYDGQRWHENWSFDQETGTEPRTLNFTVHE